MLCSCVFEGTKYSSSSKELQYSDNIFYSLYGMNVSMIIIIVEDLTMILDDIRLGYSFKLIHRCSDPSNDFLLKNVIHGFGYMHTSWDLID